MEPLAVALRNYESSKTFFGGIMLLFQIVIAFSILSMIVFACVDPPPVEEEKKDEEKGQIGIDPEGASELVGEMVGCCLSC